MTGNGPEERIGNIKIIPKHSFETTDNWHKNNLIKLVEVPYGLAPLSKKILGGGEGRGGYSAKIASGSLQE